MFLKRGIPFLLLILTKLCLAGPTANVDSQLGDKPEGSGLSDDELGDEEQVEEQEDEGDTDIAYYTDEGENQTSYNNELGDEAQVEEQEDEGEEEKEEEEEEEDLVQRTI